MPSWEKSSCIIIESRTYADWTLTYADFFLRWSACRLRESALFDELDDQGDFVAQHDFIDGWLQSNDTTLGRPVDVLMQADGTMYITDDKEGVGLVYLVRYAP